MWKSFELPDLINELGRLVIKYLTDYKSAGLSGSIPESNPDKIILKLHSRSEKLLHDFILRNKAGKVDFDNPDYSFKIGNVKIKNPLISAPLAGISDNTFRIFARFFGSALNCTEMITSYGIIYRHKKSLTLADITDYERPCAVQIFGPVPEIIAEAADRLKTRRIL